MPNRPDAAAPGSVTASSLLLALAFLVVVSPIGAFACGQRRKRRRLEREVVKLREHAERQTQLRDEERSGRTRAEQRLRKALQEKSGNGETAQGQEKSSSSSSKAKGNPDGGDGFVFRPIGVLHSCYRSRCGTPRQGGLVPQSLAVLRCSRDLNPNAALEGFKSFSHCWVLYVFHENTNLHRENRTSGQRQEAGPAQRRGRVPPWQGLCMKVAPPRCPNIRVGVLSCRTPHRPNPVGLSLARIIRVNQAAGEVILSGLDVVNGTPCLDLKPYLPGFESVPSAKVPDWVQMSYEEPLMHVEWAPAASAALDDILSPDREGKPLKPYPFASSTDLRAALESTLSLDIRSPPQKSRHPNPGATNHEAEQKPFFTGDLWFHELHITYALLPSKSSKAQAWVRIEEVEWRTREVSETLLAAEERVEECVDTLEEESLAHCSTVAVQTESASEEAQSHVRKGKATLETVREVDNEMSSTPRPLAEGFPLKDGLDRKSSSQWFKVLSESCPAGHHLNKEDTPEDGWSCSECHTVFPKGSKLYGCRECDYDVCIKCFCTKLQPPKDVGKLS